MKAIRKALALLTLAIAVAAVTAPAFAQDTTSGPSVDQGANSPLFAGAGSEHDNK